MITEFFHWQFVQGPEWLLKLLWNFQRLLFRYFSVTYMLRTILAPWHKDTLEYRGGLSKILMSFLWNITSRLIGLIIRLSVIVFWLLLEAIIIPASLIILVFFFTWPVITITVFSAGAALVFM